MKSNHIVRFCVFSWPSFALVDSLNPQIQQHVLDQSKGFSFTNICFWISFNSINLDLKASLNHLTKVSIVNLSSTENSSGKDVDFWRTKMFKAASFSWLNVTASKYLTCSWENRLRL